MSRHRHNRILIVRTDRIGDVVLSTPLIRAVRKAYPDAFLAAMVRSYARDVLLQNPHLDRILPDDPDGDQAGMGGFLRQVRRIRRLAFDTALVLLPKSRISWMLFLAGIPYRVSVEVRLDHVLTLTRTVSRNKYRPLRHEADYCLDLGRKIGVESDGLDVEVFLTNEERNEALSFLQAGGYRIGEKLVGIHPGSGGSAPNWKPERYREVAKQLLADGNIRIVVTGSETDRELVSVVSALDNKRVIRNEGRSLRQTMGVISHMNVLLSASTGPMHLAAALNVPTVSLFCPLPACSPELWGPSGNNSSVILPKENYCQVRCPGDPHRCDFEGGILPHEVADAMLGFLQG